METVNIDTLSTILKAIDIHLILLFVIIALLIILIIGRFGSKMFIEKKKSPHSSDSGEVEQENSIDNFLKILPELPEEIKKLQEYKAKAEDYDRSENPLEEIRAEKFKLEEEKPQLSIQTETPETDLENKDKEVADKLQEIETQNKANKELLDKVRKAEHFKDYAGKVFDYIRFFDDILKTADVHCIEFGKKDEETAKIMSALLQQALKKTTEMAKWKQICSDIKEIGFVFLNKDIKNCFQSKDETEQLKAFKKQCISKLKIHTNAVLILCEAYGNLSKFVEKANAENIEIAFANNIKEIKNKATEVGVTEIAEVEIFTNISNNKGAEADFGDVSFPYSTVETLSKDDIAEIVSYGMKSEFDGNISKTKVLIK
jgi:hypothetical protein